MRCTLAKLVLWGSCCSLAYACSAQSGPAQAGAAPAVADGPVASADGNKFRLKTTVRRVVVDVVVTDAKGEPVHGLTEHDFTIDEDGRQQTVLSFEANGFKAGMDYLPPKLPGQPPNTFVNLPATPEKGPLYVLLYDLVNMDNDQTILNANQTQDQIRGRQQLVKFIQSKPEGARFAIYVWSDGLHMLQGFTSDRALLYAAIDPHSSRPHIPEIFLGGENFGRGEPHATVAIFRQLAADLDGLPGRKNLIWFSGTFPLTFSPGKDDGPQYTDQLKRTIDLLASNQIAIYPIDVRGVAVENWQGTNGIEKDGAVQSERYAGGAAPPSDKTGGAIAGAPSAAEKSSHRGGGSSLIPASYFAQDEIAEQTGGHAFHGNNDLSALLNQATEAGVSYYTLTYSPTDLKYDGRARSIRVRLPEKGYHVDYRRSYYATDTAGPQQGATLREVSAKTAGAAEQRSDPLAVYLRHGAPAAHAVVFVAHVHPMGSPIKGIPESLPEPGQEAAALSPAHKRAAKTPVLLQKFAIDYTVMAHLSSSSAPGAVHLEFAAAAYDADGKVLSATANSAMETGVTATGQPAKAYRAQELVDVPVAATSLRFAVQDVDDGRIGAMEIKLPLAGEPSAAAGSKP